MKKLVQVFIPALILFSGLAHAQIQFSWTVNAGPLNPHQMSPNQMYAQAMVYEPLVRYAKDGEVIPWLAESWQISDNGKSYRFFLRQDVKFSNGEAFDASAVKANFEQLLKSIEKHRWLELINQIEAVEVVDEFTLDLHLRNPYYPTLQELSFVRPVRFMAPSAMPEKGNTGEGIKAPVGTGPWMLKESVLGVKDVFVRNPDYWGELPKAKQVEVSVIADPNARAMAFESGMINLIYGLEGQISPDTFERFRHRGDVHTALSEPVSTRLIAMNTARSATKELPVRVAINHALNKKAISEKIFYGTETPAATLFAENPPYTDVGLTAYRYDPALASSLLEQAGWHLSSDGVYREKSGRLLSLDLVYHGQDANQKAIAEVLQANLKKAGIRLSLVAEERSRFYKRQKAGEFDLIFNNTWGSPYDPHAFMSSMRRPAHADYMAQTGLENKAEIDSNIMALLTSTDESKRRDLYKQVLTTLHQQAVYLPVTYMRVTGVSSQDLGELEMGNTVFDIPFEKLGTR
ncbi:nickel ABC transporter substrate-binding protein [Vibrio sp. JC009]|uniref:nickel ABC transporter substrate-binding protein n=1 Tax=Vibrio sp. JC009 TaxID=2912314 RepID=UPI0023B1E282|nr:nickel ABC transporter substrate-binding protein [Vibrio sp. JC009]WED21705.1 nickel ABC transporter substrate-binding protein [Vibrio sp. JC009]